MSEWVKVSSAGELLEAAAHPGAQLEIDGTISGMPMVRLAPGARLRGGHLLFGARGLQLTRDNALEAISVQTLAHEQAILNDSSDETLGTIVLENVRTVGQVCLLAEDRVRAGRVEVRGLHIEHADMRGRMTRPAGFGVQAMQGAFTLWNQQPSHDSTLTASLLDISAGTAGTPVNGSGVFVAGHGKTGGTLTIEQLRTGEIHCDGGIRAGTPDLISGGVFVVSGAVVEHVINAGPVTTYGPNDMVLDNWGRVNTWTAGANVTSHGPSAIGFVNFGDIDTLEVQAAIETRGAGARGFNLYDGTLNRAVFESIRTFGDVAVGIQVAKELPVLEIRGDLETTGGQGLSLVKGVQQQLRAIALSVQAGGRIGTVEIGGRLITHGDGVTTLEVSGVLERLKVAGGISALGAGSDAVHTTGAIAGLDATDVHAPHGRTLVQMTA